MSQQSWGQQSTLCNQCNEKLRRARAGSASAPARETRIRTPEDNLLYPEWRNQTQSQLGTTCATSGEEGHSRIQWSANKSLLPFFWSVPETTAIVFLESWELMNGSCELAATLSTVLPCVQIISSLICGGGGKLGKETDGGAAFEYFPSPPPRVSVGSWCCNSGALEQSSGHRHICWVIKNTAFKTAAFILIYFWPECDFISSAEILCLFTLFVCHVLFFLWSTL